MSEAKATRPPKGAKLLMLDPALLRSFNALLKPFGVKFRSGSFGRGDDCSWVWVEEDGGLEASAALLKAARAVWNTFLEHGPVDDGRPEGAAFDASLDDLMRATLDARIILENRPRKPA